MAKKEKFPFKFLTPTQLEDYNKLDRDGVIEALLRKNMDLSNCVSAKKGNEYLKELGKEISDFRKDNSTPELLELEEQVKAEKEIRDEKIADAIDEYKDLSGGLNDGINACKEHVGLLLDLLGKNG